MDVERKHFTWDGYCWVTEVHLESWVGFQSRRGDYACQDSDEKADGSVELAFAPEGREDGALLDSELVLVRWLLQNERGVGRALLSGLLAEYPNLQDRFREFLGEKAPTLMPDVADVHEFRSLVGLSRVYVHQVESGGLPYVGFELGCTWDDEHSLGVLMHGVRVVEIGGADTAFLLWIAKKDADKGAR